MSDRICRAMLDASAELGCLSSALLLLDSCLLDGKHKVTEMQRAVGRGLPVFEAISRQGMTPSDFRQRLCELVSNLAEFLEEVDTLVVTAIEVELIDQIADQFRHLQVCVVCHDHRANRQRVESNFGTNVQTIKASEFQEFAHPVRSGLLVPGFDANPSAMFSTYPTASRILGEDTRNMFSDIIGADLLGVGFNFYPHGLVEVSLEHFTQVMHLPATDVLQPESYQEVVA